MKLILLTVHHAWAIACIRSFSLHLQITNYNTKITNDAKYTIN